MIKGTTPKQAEIAIVALKNKDVNYFLGTPEYRISEWQQYSKSIVKPYCIVIIATDFGMSFSHFRHPLKLIGSQIPIGNTRIALGQTFQLQ